MAAGPTYEQIATTNGNGTNTVTLSSIPQTYTDLRLIIVGKTTVVGSISLRFNSDANNNYSNTQLWGPNGSPVAYTQREANQPQFTMGDIDIADGGMVTVEIFNYTNTTTNKPYLARLRDTGNNRSYLKSGQWIGTLSGITSISLLAIGGTWASGAVITLYGIASA